MSQTQVPVIVIGTGLAGYNLVKEFRKQDAETPVLMITADDGCNYSKPMLSTGFTKGKSASELAMADAGKMAEQLNVTIRTNTRVTSIDPETHTIFIGEESIAYDKLVLAWGAEPVAVRIEGDAGEHIFAINDLQDYANFRAELDDKKRVLVMGAGLIGCEYANDLSNGGYEVDVVAPCNQIIPNLLPEPAASAVQHGLEGLGVKFHLGPLVRRVTQTEQGLIADLSNGEQVETDIIISAIGLRPRLDLAVKAGLQVNQGICVDRSLQTSDADIYALGDCAEVDGKVLLYVMPLMASARALAKTLAGQPTDVSYGAMPIMIKTPVVPVVVSPPATEGLWDIERSGVNVKALCRDDAGALLGYALTGTCVADKLALNKELPAILK
ncbi:Rubredoxin reductase [Oleispira antarctica RB-8]|uniref:Rubredoxin reductase n=1 Tax=Oleispira antarctica RB-8 TaxID=698738 RepID=R4YUP9_OLEAN|nr:Rubredoxin reductase [Oleispira antarctica RB-8]|tara:strand:- start:6005 stop:7156 length:1152 start_codon:yes stop_codon:yes gene_type:complete